MKAPRRELTSEERAECARLKAIFEKRQKEARDQGARMTQETLGNSIGWRSGQSAVNQYLNGKVPLNLEALLKFAAELRFTPEEVSPRLASELARGSQPAEEASNIEPGPDTKGLIPLISWVQAGSWSEVVDLYAVGDAEDWLPCPANHGSRAFALRVRGESMYDPHGRRSFREGDIVYVDPDRQHENGSLVIAKLTDSQEATFKQLVIEDEKRYLKALNPAWPERMMPINGSCHIVGVVFSKVELF